MACSATDKLEASTILFRNYLDSEKQSADQPAKKHRLIPSFVVHICKSRFSYVAVNMLTVVADQLKQAGWDTFVYPLDSVKGGGLAQWLVSRTTDQGVPGSRPGLVPLRFGLEQVTFTHCLVQVKPRKPWTYD